MNDSMDFLNYLENSNQILAISNRIGKIYDLVTLSYIDRNKNINFKLLSVEECAFLEQIESFIQYKCDNFCINEYKDTSMIFEIMDNIYKIIYVPDIEFGRYTLNFNAFSNIDRCTKNTHLIVVGKVEDRKEIINVISKIGLELLELHFNQYIGKDKVASFWKAMNNQNNDSDTNSYNYTLDLGSVLKWNDYLIVLFRILDGIFDLKFNDFDIIECANNKDLYNYAINRDAKTAEYCDIVKKTVSKCFFEENYYV